MGFLDATVATPARGTHTDRLDTALTRAGGPDRPDGRPEDFSATITEPAPDPDVVPSPGPEPTTPPPPVPAPAPDGPGIPTDPTNPATGALPRP